MAASLGFEAGRNPLISLDAPPKPRPTFRLPLDQPLEIIAKQIEAMSDTDQVQLLSMWPKVLLNFFWRENIEAAAAQKRLLEILCSSGDHLKQGRDHPEYDKMETSPASGE